MGMPELIRTIHQMCFSDQFFFLMMFHVCSIFTCVFGFQFVMRGGGNPFLDLLMPALCIATPILCYIIERVAIEHLVVRRGFWKPKNFDSRTAIVEKNQDVEDICAKIRDIRDFEKDDLETVLKAAISQAAEESGLDRGRVEKMKNSKPVELLGNLSALGVDGFDEFKSDAFALNPEWPEEFGDGRLDDEEEKIIEEEERAKLEKFEE